MQNDNFLLSEDDIQELYEEWDPSDAVSDSVKLYLNQISGTKVLTASEEKELLRCAAKGDADAKIALVEHNLKLVVSIAKRYRGCGIPFLDLIQEGNLGLMTAVDKYNFQRGTRFSTCATCYIRREINNALSDQTRTIRIPAHILDLLSKIKKAGARIEQDIGRPAKDHELAEALGVDAVKIRAALDMSQALTSLDSPIGDDDGSIGDFIPDYKGNEALDNLIEEANHEIIENVLDTLAPREARILRLRFGLNGETPKTLEDVGVEVGVTRERVRQIEAKALRKLRHPSRTMLLQQALN